MYLTCSVWWSYQGFHIEEAHVWFWQRKGEYIKLGKRGKGAEDPYIGLTALSALSAIETPEATISNSVDNRLGSRNCQSSAVTRAKIRF